MAADGVLAIAVGHPGPQDPTGHPQQPRAIDGQVAVEGQGLQPQAAAAAGRPLNAGGLDLLAGGLDEAGLPLNDDDVAEQLLLLLFAGYETTASSLSCLLLALLQHPKELAWLQEELV
ncbi:MAG: cytochrome P450, partial [Cyanobium sp. ELA507]